MTITVPWTKDRSYTFIGEQLKSNPHKTVYSGEFLGSAPPGVTPYQPYCLKIITPPEVDILHFPQCREFYDLLDLTGPHLRKTLAKNDAADRISKELKASGRFLPLDGDIYVSVEPLYNHLKNPEEYSVKERLEIIRQVGLGCQELYQEENAIGSYKIVSHREIKANNVCVDNSGCIKLIDFASIKIDDPSVANKDTTFLTPMSPSNTSPEYIDEAFGCSSEKSDVFALGTLLSSFFILNEEESYVNPLQLWISHCGLSRKELACAYHKALDARGFLKPWVLSLLLSDFNIELHWDKTLSPTLAEKIEALFTRGISLFADDRPTMSEFISEIAHLIKFCDGYNGTSEISILVVDQTDLNKIYLDCTDEVKYPCLITGFDRSIHLPSMNTKNCFLAHNEQEGKKYLSDLEPLEPAEENSSSNYLYALFQAYKYLANHSHYIFGGNLYIMASDKPSSIRLLHLNDGHKYNAKDMLEALIRDIEPREVLIKVFSLNNPGCIYGRAEWHPIKPAPIPVPSVVVPRITGSIPEGAIVPQTQALPMPVEKNPRTGTGRYGKYVHIGEKYYYKYP